MPHRTLLIAFFTAFAMASFWLFWENAREQDPTYQKNWWVVAFVEPANEDDSSFFVSNYTEKETFSYRVSRDGQEVSAGTLMVPQGAERVVPIPEAGDFLVEVFQGAEKKNIYRK